MKMKFVFAFAVIVVFLTVVSNVNACPVQMTPAEENLTKAMVDAGFNFTGKNMFTGLVFIDQFGQEFSLESWDENMSVIIVRYYVPYAMKFMGWQSVNLIGVDMARPDQILFRNEIMINGNNVPIGVHAAAEQIHEASYLSFRTLI